MFGFRKSENKAIKLAPVLTEPENPVNYTSVLDYLIGLSQSEYGKILKVSGIYRKAKKAEAKILGVKDEPTTMIKEDQPSDTEIDNALDAALDATKIDFEDDTPAKEVKNAKRVDIKKVK